MLTIAGSALAMTPAASRAGPAGRLAVGTGVGLDREPAAGSRSWSSWCVTRPPVDPASRPTATIAMAVLQRPDLRGRSPDAAGPSMDPTLRLVESVRASRDARDL